MALFDKLTDIAKQVGDKTGDMLEIGKLNARIVSTNAAISDLKSQLGEHYLNLYLEGISLDSEATEICDMIKENLDKISAIQAEIASLKAEKATPYTPAAPAGASAACPACGAKNSADAKFCKDCGCKIEHECQCEECTCDKAEAPAPKVCPTCGVENAADMNFCDKCGAKL